MHFAPFKAIRPKPQNMQAWVNRQIDDYSEYLTGEIDFISLIQPSVGKSEEIRTRLKSYQKQNLLVTDAEPSLYLLQIQDDDVQTLGFIGCADTSLLVNKTIRPHEDVKKDQENTLRNIFKTPSSMQSQLCFAIPPTRNLRILVICLQTQNLLFRLKEKGSNTSFGE